MDLKFEKMSILTDISANVEASNRRSNQIEEEIRDNIREQVKKRHEEKTKNLMEGQYFEIVEKIFAPQKTGGIEVYTILLETYKTRYGESVYEMLQMYLRFILSI